MFVCACVRACLYVCACVSAALKGKKKLKGVLDDIVSGFHILSFFSKMPQNLFKFQAIELKFLQGLAFGWNRQSGSKFTISFFINIFTTFSNTGWRKFKAIE